MNLIVPALAERSAVLASPSAPPAPDRASAILHAARLLLPTLEQGQALDAAILRAAMEAAFGTTDAAGTWVWKDAYEACEAAQVLFLRRHGPAMRSRAGCPAGMLAMLARLAALAPTHSATRHCHFVAALRRIAQSGRLLTYRVEPVQHCGNEGLSIGRWAVPAHSAALVPGDKPGFDPQLRERICE